MASRKALVREILRRYPKSQAEELGLRVGENTPSQLFRWLIASLLFSARISAGQAEKTANALFRSGWRTAKTMSETSWEERVKVLNRSGYARYDESTARYIGDSTALLVDRYGGDLRKLREAAHRDPEQERALLKRFKGIGDVGADIFFREVQLAWSELYPFSDEKALEAARALDLGDDARALARVVDERSDLPRLLAGLVRIGLHHEEEDIRNAA